MGWQREVLGKRARTTPGTGNRRGAQTGTRTNPESQGTHEQAAIRSRAARAVSSTVPLWRLSPPRSVQQLGGVTRAGVNDVPAAPVVLTPARGDSGLGAVIRLAVGVVHEAVAVASFHAPGPGVVHEGEGSRDVEPPRCIALGAASRVLIGFLFQLGEQTRYEVVGNF